MLADMGSLLVAAVARFAKPPRFPAGEAARQGKQKPPRRALLHF
jgi:hypothetical protein